MIMKLNNIVLIQVIKLFTIIFLIMEIYLLVPCTRLRVNELNLDLMAKAIINLYHQAKEERENDEQGE